MLVPTRLSPNRASDGFQVTNVLERGLGKLCSLVPQRLMFVLYFAVMLLPLPAETTGSCEVFTNLQLWTFPFITLAASLFAGFSLGFHWGWSERDFSHQFLIYGSAQEFLVALVLNVICRSMKVPCGVFWPLAMLSRTFRERFAVSLFRSVSCTHTSTKMQPVRYKFLPPFSRFFTEPQLAAATG